MVASGLSALGLFDEPIEALAFVLVGAPVGVLGRLLGVPPAADGTRGCVDVGGVAF
jgi:hypothetical protein